ncbi:MAG: hypothetical protein AB7V77_03710 [Candidatus Woesearchaeota archaeon]
MDIYEWTKHFVGFKIRNKKNIITKFETDKIIIEENKEFTKYFIDEKIENCLKKWENDSDKDKINKLIYVCLNSQKNIEDVYVKWSKFIENPNLTVIFVDLIKDSKWLIKPYIHDKIADKDNLKEGLISMYSNI